jgi:hypothetical protein
MAKAEELLSALKRGSTEAGRDFRRGRFGADTDED